MTARQLANLAADETCDRVSRAVVDIVDACTGEDCPLTPQQKQLVLSGLLRECMGLRSDLERMFSNAHVLSRFAVEVDGVEAWLAEQDDERRH